MQKMAGQSRRRGSLKRFGCESQAQVGLGRSAARLVNQWICWQRQSLPVAFHLFLVLLPLTLPLAQLAGQERGSADSWQPAFAGRRGQ